MRDAPIVQPVVVDQLGPCSLKKSVETPDTFGFNTALHATRVTVHGGNHFPRLAVITERCTWCCRRIWSIQSWGVPFQCEHHDTGTATTVPSPNDTLILGVPCHAQCVAQNTSICVLAGCKTGACIHAASTTGQFAVVSSLSTKIGATVAAGYSFSLSFPSLWVPGGAAVSAPVRLEASISGMPQGRNSHHNLVSRHARRFVHRIYR